MHNSTVGMVKVVMLQDATTNRQVHLHTSACGWRPSMNEENRLLALAVGDNCRNTARLLLDRNCLDCSCNTNEFLVDC